MAAARSPIGKGVYRSEGASQLTAKTMPVTAKTAAPTLPQAEVRWAKSAHAIASASGPSENHLS